MLSSGWSHVPVEKIWAFYPQIAPAFLHRTLPLPSVTFCVKLAWKLLTLSGGFKVAGRISPDAAGDKTGE